MTTTPNKQIVLASGNEGKLSEIQYRLGYLPYSLVTQSTLNIPSPDETGLTFVENAILKARHAAKLSGLPAIADDSGLAVDALQGAPGIYSARYSGLGATDASNNQLLLDQLRHLPEKECTARFHCIIVYLAHAEDPTPLIFEGVWHGYITQKPKGKNGFGYDPLFMVPDLGRTAAELPRDKKNQVSHRGQALSQLIDALSKQHTNLQNIDGLPS